ncbi:MAG TPA: hypothetical protein VLF14_10095 [Candidatus Binatia bacterium]|nr:hypothetical protein [Candidatus Binatia bacterium]
MKCRTLPALLIGPLLLAVASCVPHRGSSQEVATDLHNYSVELQKWEEKEKSIFQAIDDVEESQYVDDDFVLRTLKGALPTLDEHIREVATYRPVTAELGDLHSHYREGWENLRSAFDSMIAAVAKKDYVALAKGKSQMKAARGLLLKAFASMDALMEENDEALKNLRKS